MQEPLEAGLVEAVGHHDGHDVSHRLPAHPEQLGDRRLVGALGQPGHDVLKVPGMPSSRSCPRDLLGADPPAACTVDPTDLGFEETPGRAQVKMSPATDGTVVDGPGLPPARAAASHPAPAEPDHDAFGSKGDALHRCPNDGQHLVECSGDAHVSSRVARFAWSLSETTRAARARRIAKRPRPVAGTRFIVAGEDSTTAGAKGSLHRPPAALDPRLLRQITHTYPRRTKKTPGPGMPGSSSKTRAGSASSPV